MKTFGQVTIYQVRLDREDTPWDVIYSLTHMVWKTVTRAEDMRKLEPLRWSDLYLSLRRVFEKRLARYTECGTQPWCDKSPAQVLWSNHSITKIPSAVYLLSVQGNVDRFISGICALTWKCMTRAGQVPVCGRTVWREGVSAAIKQILKDHLFFTDRCLNCPIRQEARGWQSW